MVLYRGFVVQSLKYVSLFNELSQQFKAKFLNAKYED